MHNLNYKVISKLFNSQIIKFFTSNNKTAKINYAYDTREFISKVKEYEEKLDDRSKDAIIDDEPITGYANEEGTHSYSKRNIEEVHKEHFRTFYDSNIKVSSIGLGTYIGAPDDITDFYMYNAIKSCVFTGGVNIIDTSINYRYMKSERIVGKALKALISKYDYNRNEFVICSKIGYVPEDADNGNRCHYFVKNLIEENKISIEDVIFDDKKRPVHCMHPEYLKSQLDLSLKNLNLSTIDIMYLQNAYESQGPIIPEEMFIQRLSKAFEFFVINSFNTLGKC